MTQFLITIQILLRQVISSITFCSFHLWSRNFVIFLNNYPKVIPNNLIMFLSEEIPNAWFLWRRRYNTSKKWGLFYHKNTLLHLFFHGKVKLQSIEHCSMISYLKLNVKKIIISLINSQNRFKHMFFRTIYF